MFIKLRQNSNGILAVNLKNYSVILIEQNAGELVLKVSSDMHTINIESYPTPQRAAQAFQNVTYPHF